MAHDKKAHQKKAEAAYKEISGAVMSMKDLVAGVKAATAIKAANNKAANKKSYSKKDGSIPPLLVEGPTDKELDKIRKASAVTAKAAEKAAKQIAKDADAWAKEQQKDLKESAKLQQAGVGILKAEGTRKGIDTAKKFIDCKRALDAAEAKLIDVVTFNFYSKEIDKDISQSLQLAGKGTAFFGVKAVKVKQSYQNRVIKATREFSRLRALYLPSLKIKEAAELKAKARAEDPRSATKRFFDHGTRDTNGVLSMRGSASKGLAFVGGKIGGKIGQMAREDLGALTGALAKPIGHMMDNNPRVANAIRWVGKGVNTLATNVKDASHEAFTWIGKKLSFLGNKLQGFLTKHMPSTTGFFGTLLGLAALLPTIIGPALKGIDAALTERFGPDYIQTFMKGLWANAWGFLTEKVKSLLGMKTAAEEKSEAAAKNSLLNPTAANSKAASDASAEVHQQRFDRTGDPEQKFLADKDRASPYSPQAVTRERLQTAIDNGRSWNVSSLWTSGSKFLDNSALQAQVDAAPPGTITDTMATQLQAMGVKVNQGGRSNYVAPALNTRIQGVTNWNTAPVLATKAPSSGYSPTPSWAMPAQKSSGNGASTQTIPNRMGDNSFTAVNLMVGP